MGSSAHEGSQLANTRYVTDARGAARLVVVVVVVVEVRAGGREGNSKAWGAQHSRQHKLEREGV
jgi:hypothetical protein